MSVDYVPVPTAELVFGVSGGERHIVTGEAAGEALESAATRRADLKVDVTTLQDVVDGGAAPADQPQAEAMVRRYLVDHGLLERTATGTQYALPAD